MRNPGTVPEELSQKEAKEFHSAVLQQLPDIPINRARYFIRHKSELGKRLREALVTADRAVSGIITEWEKFYLKYFGMEVDLSGVRIPDDPGGFERLLVVAGGLTLNRAFEACKSKFLAWKYADDLDRDVTQNKRTAQNGNYAIRVRDRVEADEELAGRSADWVKDQGLVTETLLERLVHELKFFDETGKHLDVNNVTLCSGSRHSDGGVPGVNWDVGRLVVNWYKPQGAYPHLRARAAVS